MAALIQRVASWLAQEVVVPVLAKSKPFQAAARASVDGVEKVKAVTKNAADAAAVAAAEAAAKSKEALAAARAEAATGAGPDEVSPGVFRSLADAVKRVRRAAWWIVRVQPRSFFCGNARTHARRGGCTCRCCCGLRAPQMITGRLWLFFSQLRRGRRRYLLCLDCCATVADDYYDTDCGYATREPTQPQQTQDLNRHGKTEEQLLQEAIEENRRKSMEYYLKEQQKNLPKN
jgi:hypothetical protein